MKVPLWKKEYRKPQITVFGNAIGALQKDPANLVLSLTYKDILCLVEGAYAEIEGDLLSMIEIKRQVLGHVAENHFIRALRTAIVGASKVASPVAISMTSVSTVPGIACGRRTSYASGSDHDLNSDETAAHSFASH